MNIKRFAARVLPVSDEDGAWVSYTDHIAALEAVKATRWEDMLTDEEWGEVSYNVNRKTANNQPDIPLWVLKETVKQARYHCAAIAPSPALEANQQPHHLAAFPGGLPLGLYVIHWKSGGTSEAAIGMSSNGQRWIAPTNWIAPGLVASAGEWGEIERAERVDLEANQQVIETLRAEKERLLALIRWAHETLYEINPSNYDHDEVCKLNDASVEVILGLAPTLGETHGQTAEWWAARAAITPPTQDEEERPTREAIESGMLDADEPCECGECTVEECDDCCLPRPTTQDEVK